MCASWRGESKFSVMKRRFAGWLDRLQRAAARWPTAVRAAEKLRNQAEAIMGYSLAETPHAEENGERLLLEMVAERIESFVDVGANVGDWSDLIVAGVAQAAEGLLFEPNPAAAARLRKRFSGNPRVEVIEVALSDKIGRARFSQEANCGEASSLVNAPRDPAFTSIDVDTATLDGVLRGKRWSHVDFLKIDAEGHDFNVMVGARDLLARRAVRFLQFEYGGFWAKNGSTLGRAIDFLSEFGYETRVITPRGPRQYLYETFREFYRYCNFVAAVPQEWESLARARSVISFVGRGRK